MTFKEKLNELDGLYDQVKDITMSNNVMALTYDDLVELNNKVEKIKVKIISLEDEMFRKNPNYLGELSIRMH